MLRHYTVSQKALKRKCLYEEKYYFFCTYILISFSFMFSGMCNFILLLEETQIRTVLNSCTIHCLYLLHLPFKCISVKLTRTYLPFCCISFSLNNFISSFMKETRIKSLLRCSVKSLSLFSVVFTINSLYFHFLRGSRKVELFHI